MRADGSSLGYVPHQISWQLSGKWNSVKIFVEAEYILMGLLHFFGYRIHRLFAEAQTTFTGSELTQKLLVLHRADLSEKRHVRILEV